MRYLIAAIVLLFSYQTNAFELKIADKVSYQVVKADTPEKMQRGLMFVKDLPQNEGMWFDLRNFDYVAMWMKNTYITLDMLFVGCDFRIKDIYKNAEPLSLKKITSESDFCYVLEINGGESEKHQFKIGDKISTVPHRKVM